MASVIVTYIDLGKYVRIYEEYKENRKTPIYYLYNQLDERIELGEIKWNGKWRKYCFYPYDETLYDTQCLMDIALFMDKLNKEKRNKKC